MSLWMPRRLLTPGALGGAGTATVWGTVDDDLTKSNSDRTLTRNAGGNFNVGAKTANGTASGQIAVWEVVVDTAITWSFAFGACTATTAVEGIRTPGVGLSPDTGFVISNNGVLACVDSTNHSDTIITGGFTTSDVLMFVIDHDNGLGWVSKDGGSNWNTGLVGTQTPVSDGGFDIPFAGPYHPTWGADSVTGDAVTANFAIADMSGTPPGGATQIAGS